ncbi:MAG: hypothetical protein HND56_12745 [Pseudomonadota bacterium]|nr:hypothetical protein [Pseudomonadota bacterium]QKK06493.1 MAG: hypothetical protein HND56_12745 [Pseudomonadota bacterium]
MKKQLFLLTLLLILIYPHSANACLVSRSYYLRCEETEQKSVFLLAGNRFFKVSSDYFLTKTAHQSLLKGKPFTVFAVYDTWQPLCHLIEDKQVSYDGNVHSLFHNYPATDHGGCYIHTKKGPNIPDIYENAVKIIINAPLISQDTYTAAAKSGKTLPIRQKQAEFASFIPHYRLPLSLKQRFLRYIGLFPPRRNSSDYIGWEPARRVFFEVNGATSNMYRTSVLCEYKQEDINPDHDPMATWISDGDLRQWDLCEVRFFYKENHHHSNLPVTVLVHGKHLKTNEKGLNLRPFTDNISGFIRSAIRSPHDPELLRHLQETAE